MSLIEKPFNPEMPLNVPGTGFDTPNPEKVPFADDAVEITANTPQAPEESAAVGGIAKVISRLKRAFGRHAEDGSTEEKVLADANYDLTDEELAQLDNELVSKVRGLHGKTLASVWVGSSSPYANIVRTHENRIFPTSKMPELFHDYEDESVFMLTVDTRKKGANRVIRGSRLSSPQFSVSEEAVGSDEVRIPMVQDMVKAGEFTNQEFVDYYSAKGADLHTAVSVETNFRIGGRAPRVLGHIAVADIAYLSFYRMTTRGHATNPAESVMFAHINEATTNSLARAGIDHEPLMGNDQLRTPTGDGEFDPDFRPVAMFDSPSLQRKMRWLGMLAPKEVYL